MVSGNESSDPCEMGKLCEGLERNSKMSKEGEIQEEIGRQLS